MDRFVIPPAGPNPLRVLIVEDEALVAMEIESMLDMAGHQALGHADDLDSAIKAVEAQKPDLALVDIQLAQGSNGIEVARAMKERGVPVMFATGNCPAEEGRGLALGCLHKPISDRTLAATLAAAKALIDGEQPAKLPPGVHIY